MRDKGFIWNLSNFECNVINHEMLVSIQAMKIVSVGKKLVEKLVDECTGAVEEVKLAKITLAENENK